jgi:simple sugar transport system ATP-binding protein/ribose transport system ATP-binding protein
VTALIRLTGIDKRFGGTQALSGVDLEIASGTVHALVGENGAGKSTLGKVVAGVIAPDSGTYELAGRTVNLSSPRQALDLGITMMAQELSLVPSRSVVENVYLGIEPHIGPFVRRRELTTLFSQLVEETGIHVHPNVLVNDLSVGDQQKVEILRALAREASIIVMDEPTARLSKSETLALKNLARKLAESGRTVIFVSHFLSEVLSIADQITTMRDGQVVRTSLAVEETEESLIEAMTGRAFTASFPDRIPIASNAPIALSVKNLSRKAVFSNINFDVRNGEIVALTGLVGSGRSEILLAIFGDLQVDSGDIKIAEASYDPRNPRHALNNKIALVPESRKDQGLFLNLSVESNITMPYLKTVGSLGFVSTRAAGSTAQKAAGAVGVKTESTAAPIASLSGGNQQKTLFARALLDSPDVLLADEPTRGVDVAAKRAIYDLLATRAAKGMGILMVSSETEEVLGLAHRILVMHKGRIVAELAGESATEEGIMTAAFGSPEVNS